MRITILNKNKLDGVEQTFECDKPQILKENYNETLDDLNIRISHLSTRIAIEPYDIVKVEGFLGTRYMCVNNYTSRQDGLDNATYSYDIAMFSQTKLLEGIILPNLAITPHKSGKHSIFHYLRQFLNLYGRKEHRQSGRGVNKWYFAERVEDKFSNDCPELQWNTPTLREVFNDLMMVNDCIPILRGNEIDYFDLTEIITDIRTKQGINYIRESQSADDYISEIKMEMQNVMQTSIDGINDVTTTAEFLMFSTENYVVNSENFVLKTQYPILSIKHLWMYSYYFTGRYNGDGLPLFRLIREDLCNLRKNDNKNFGSLVYEKDEYNTKEILYRLDFTENDKTADVTNNSDIEDYYSKYQNYCIYYTRGGNEIDGFKNVSNAKRFGSTRQTYQFLIWLLNYIYGIHDTQRPYPTIQLPTLDGTANYFSCFFQVEYETMQSAVFTASKAEKQNARVIMDNQTNSYVDAYTQGNLEYQKANRLGNKALLINQRVIDNSEVIKIGDFFPVGNDSKYIVYETQYQIYPDHTEVNAYATKDYVLKNYFTGVKSKIRTWNNAQKEALIRHDLHKLYGEFSFSQHKEKYRVTYDYASYFLSPLISAYSPIKPIKYVASNFTLPDNTQYPTRGNYLSDCVVRLIGQSITFTFALKDNAYFGKNIDLLSENDDEEKLVTPYSLSLISVSGGWIPAGFSVSGDVGGVIMQPLPYSNSENNYEVKSFFAKFITDYDLGMDVGIEYIGRDTSSVSDVGVSADFMKKVGNLPLITTADIGDNVKFVLNENINKDNKEIPIETMQFEFCSDTKDIYVTKRFISLQQSIRNVNLPPYRLYIADGIVYNKGDENLPTTATQVQGSISIETLDNTTAQITFNGIQTQGDKVLYVAGINNDIWLAIRLKTAINNPVIHFNVLNDRDVNIYDDDGEIIGQI